MILIINCDGKGGEENGDSINDGCNSIARRRRWIFDARRENGTTSTGGTCDFKERASSVSSAPSRQIIENL